MRDFDEEEELQALRLSELSSEEFDRQVRALDQPKTDTTSNNGAGAQKESVIKSSDFAAAGPNSALQAFEDIQLNLATSELLQEELPAGAYEEQILQLLLQLDSQPEHEALESAMQGDTLLEQVEETEDVEFLERSLAALLLSTDICSGDHSDEPASLSILGIGLLARFQRVGDLGDLEHGIDANRRAVDLTPDSHPDKPMYLNILGNGLFLRFERLGELGDLECAIDANRRAVDLTPDDHPDKPVHLNSLGSGFQRRFDHVGELRGLEYGIDANRRAVYLTPNGHPDKPGYLSNLAIGLFHRFEHLGELGDLEHGLNANRRAVDLTPDGHPDKPGRLNNLGSGFLISFEHVGNLEDLERAIDASRRAADLTPDGHPDKPGYLSNLGNGFIRHFERHGELGDLERAIDASRRAVELTPGNHPDKPRYLNNLGNCFRSRFERYGKLGDLESAINANLHAVNLTPNDHPDKPAILDNFGNSLLGRFERVGELGDLERAIDASCRAVDLTPDGHPDKPGRLSSLGNGFLTRFGRGGELGDLERAIDAIRRAADLTPDGHPHKPMHLNNLGNGFLTRFERVGEREDLERAIDASRHAVDLTPNGHPDKPMYLHNLGNGFFLRFERVGELEDLEHAIDASLRAVDLTPDSHDHKPVHLNGLGNGFLIRFERVGELRDLEFAIDASRRAVNLTPDGHPRKPMHLNSLGSGFFLRFERVGEIEDLERAIDATQRAVDLTPDDHPDKPGYLNNLGSGFQRRFGHVGGPGDLQDVLKVYLRAADQQSGPPTIRLKAVKQWADICWAGLRYDFVTHDELVSVYERAITLIPQVAWLGKSIGQRFEELARISQLVNGAVAAAIEAGQLTRAVEWFDQGRGVVWGQLLQLRNPLDDLRAIRPELAEDLQTISHDLEKSSGLSARRQSLQDQAADRILQDEASQRIRLAEKRDDVLKAIRNINGFDRFLMPKLYPTLARASEGGPVILINVHESRCDALIICSPAEDLIHLSLSKLSPEGVTDMHQQFLSLLQQAGVRGRGDEDADGSDDYRAVKPYTFHKADFSDILSRLWLCVVHPVLEAIKEKLRSPIINALPHVTWCATGALAFLPLHAAGEYGLEGGRKVFDFVVSSYTPTLSTLLQTSASLADVSSKSNKILVISQPQTPGQCSLPAALEEVAKIRQHFTEDQVIHKNGADAEVNAVLGAINDYHPQCIHFACHGVQDANDPASSAFFLHDAKLELRQLMATSEAGAKLAFLSACQTAKGDVKLPEEAVHLAAGMLSVGCQAVVGTLWSIKDKDAPVVADEFYRRLRENEAGSSKEGRAHVAYALHGAAEVLRRKVGESEFLRWAAFVHLGR